MLWQQVQYAFWAVFSPSQHNKQINDNIASKIEKEEYVNVFKDVRKKKDKFTKSCKNILRIMFSGFPLKRKKKGLKKNLCT